MTDTPRDETVGAINLQDVIDDASSLADLLSLCEFRSSEGYIWTFNDEGARHVVDVVDAWNRRAAPEPDAQAAYRAGDEAMREACATIKDIWWFYSDGKGGIPDSYRMEAAYRKAIRALPVPSPDKRPITRDTAPTEAQRREIAEAWDAAFGDTAIALSISDDSEALAFTERLDRIEAALRAAGLLGDEHDQR